MGLVVKYQPSAGELLQDKEFSRQVRKCIEKVQTERKVKVVVVGDCNAHIGRDMACGGHVGLHESETLTALRGSKSAGCGRAS